MSIPKLLQSIKKLSLYMYTAIHAHAIRPEHVIAGFLVCCNCCCNLECMHCTLEFHDWLRVEVEAIRPENVIAGFLVCCNCCCNLECMHCYAGTSRLTACRGRSTAYQNSVMLTFSSIFQTIWIVRMNSSVQLCVQRNYQKQLNYTTIYWITPRYTELHHDILNYTTIYCSTLIRSLYIEVQKDWLTSFKSFYMQ